MLYLTLVIVSLLVLARRLAEFASHSNSPPVSVFNGGRCRPRS
jgi:hypothetical protein